jgi:hypothetical protein
MAITTADAALAAEQSVNSSQYAKYFNSLANAYLITPQINATPP